MGVMGVTKLRFYLAPMSSPPPKKRTFPAPLGGYIRAMFDVGYCDRRNIEGCVTVRR